jgi:ketosteroid isomerase-like protein
MSQLDNEAIIRTYLRAWETGSTALFDEVLAPDFMDSMFGQPRTRDMLLEHATSGDVAAERREITIEDAVSLGDTIVVRTTTRVTHAGTGTRLVTTGMIWARIRNGMIVEGWGEYDRMGQLQQLGVIPEGAELRAWATARLAERGAPKA